MFVGRLQVLLTCVHVLSVFVSQVSCGWLQMLSVPLQVWAEMTQVCVLGHFMKTLLHLLPLPEQVPKDGVGQSVSIRQVSFVALQVL